MIERSTQMLYILAAHLQAGRCSGRRFRPVKTQQVRWTDGEGGAQNLSAATYSVQVTDQVGDKCCVAHPQGSNDGHRHPSADFSFFFKP